MFYITPGGAVGSGAIWKCHLDGSKCTTIIRDMISPQAITVDIYNNR